jgi:hypothetical protein
MITLPTTPSSLLPSPTQLTPERPSPAIAEPTSPPKRAWEDDEGRPSSQVGLLGTGAGQSSDRTSISANFTASDLWSGR